ncbi:MAG: thymidylate kinase [Oscillospiraceae bacterium]|nr:thymidylate kinase [Oscillospiraceae bacterium]
MAGKLIVFEGTDGSGKSTQFRLLCDRLTRESAEFTRLVFPQYDQPSSMLLRMYLDGSFGLRPDDVNPYAASTFYAVDRYASWKQGWGDDYRAGKLILADRYITSNAVHQAAKLPEAAWEGFFDWLFDFECDKLGLPRPDFVFYMDMPTEQALALLRAREEATDTHGDIHETAADYLALCRKTAQRAAKYLGWHPVACVDDAGRVRPAEDIHAEIWQTLTRHGFIGNP